MTDEEGTFKVVVQVEAESLRMNVGRVPDYRICLIWAKNAWEKRSSGKKYSSGENRGKNMGLPNLAFRKFPVKFLLFNSPFALIRNEDARNAAIF